MKILSATDIYKWEQATMTNQNLAPAVLMERAADALSQAIQQFVGERKGTFMILCGFGNNGGDGLAVGRMLHTAGHQVDVFLVDHHFYSEENQINQQRLQAMGVSVRSLTPQSQLEFSPECIIIDALFGYGLSRALDDSWSTLLRQVNSAPNLVLSVDIPSGLFADKPTPADVPIVQADVTYTFACPKLSLLFPDYASFTGDFQVLDIGLDNDILNTFPNTYHYLQKENIQTIIHPLQKFAHKGTYGHAYIVGGRYGSIGAIVLSSRAALKTGCGLVTAYVPTCGYTVLQSAFPEALVQTDPLDTHISMFPDDIMEYDAIGLGMGLGTHPDSGRALRQLLERFRLTSKTPALLLDADAINILAANPDWHILLPPYSILTPHPKELQRLIGLWDDDFEKLEKVRSWSAEYQQIVLIKGANSAIILPDGTVHFNSTGNPGMATGGSGDVLSGIITSLLAQGYVPSEAVLLGVYLHGMAGDLAAGAIHQKSMIATDIVEHISVAWQHISRDPLSVTRDR